MNRLTGVAVLCWLACVLAHAEDAKALPVEVPPTDPNILYVGRFDKRDAAGPRADWSGSSIRVKFKGTAINAKMKTSANDFVHVIVDGEPKTAIALTKQPTTYTLASGLPDQDHTIEIFKRTEAITGQFQFMGLQLEAGGKLLPVEKNTRRIEMVGDSITCGYGNEGANQNEHFTAKTENSYMAYGSIAARELKADCVQICVSGRWLMDNDKGDSMPILWPRTLIWDPNAKWDTSNYVADVVVINLGTNDFGPGNPDATKWTDAYKTFINTLRKSYPKAHIFLAVGSMMSDAWPPEKKALSTVRGYCTSVVEFFNKAGDKDVHYVEFEQQGQANGIGSDWHPSVKTHQIMGAKLAAEIKKELKW